MNGEYYENRCSVVFFKKAEVNPVEVKSYEAKKYEVQLHYWDPNQDGF